MKRKIYLSLLILLSLTLTSCASQPVEQESPQKNAPPRPEASPPPFQGGADGGQTGPGVSVNLADLPEDDGASAKTGAENVEMPAPGMRKTEDTLIHYISVDLSNRLGIDLSQVSLIESIPTTWSNGALGCPAEGMMYTDALVEGYKITVEANGQEYTYHSHGVDRFFWCDNGLPVPPLSNK